MQIKPATRFSWKQVLDHGDIEKIVESTKTDEKPNGINRMTIGRAIRTGTMNESTFEAIQKFCKQKAEALNKIEKKHSFEIE